MDELLLHMDNLSAESNEELLDDDEDDIIPSPSIGPAAPTPAHECNISVPTLRPVEALVFWQKKVKMKVLPSRVS
jgi:hypothetical protein